MQAMPKPGGAGFYIQGLDGVRAVSIGIVFLSHLGIRRLSPGLFGVNIFFLLSGFLITTLMMREHAARGGVSIREFYVRRVLRIFPPMYLVLAAGLVLVMAGLLPAMLDPLSVVAQCLHLTNYYFIRHGGVRMIPGLELYWSLAVEEHYYLVFPLVFVLGYGRLGARRLALALAGAALAVLMWRMALVLLMHTYNPYRTSIATDTRIDSILWGCVLALWRNPALDPGAARKLADGRVCVLALAVIAGTLLIRDERFRETVSYTLQSLALIPLFCAVVLRHDWRVVRWLDTAPMRWLGKISYTFYLVHFMVIELFALNFPAWPKAAVMLAALAGTLIFCQMMRLTVELPMARIRRKHGSI